MTGTMKRFEHGGDTFSHPGAVDFSASLNPLGMPPEALEALRANVGRFDAYPDAECRELRAAIAAADGVDVAHIVCTAGASDLMQRVCLVLRPARALVTAPCFSGYEQALEQAGVEVARHVLREDEGFQVTGRIVDDVRALAGGLVFLCTPNNPTGLTLDAGLLVRVLEAAREAGATVVLDECFLDFTDGPTALPLCDEFPNLVIMRAFTKIYAMAGLRLGYGVCSDAGLLARLQVAGQPWAVSTPAQVAGIAALSAPGWCERTRDYVGRERAILEAGLREAGMRVVPSQANYVLFQSPRPLYDALLQRGFIIRRCENFEGLDASWFRIAVRTHDENAGLLAAIRDSATEGDSPDRPAFATMDE